MLKKGKGICQDAVVAKQTASQAGYPRATVCHNQLIFESLFSKEVGAKDLRRLSDWLLDLYLKTHAGPWIDFYNNRYLHPALGYKSPQEYEQLYQAVNLGKAA